MLKRRPVPFRSSPLENGPCGKGHGQLQSQLREQVAHDGLDTRLHAPIRDHHLPQPPKAPSGQSAFPSLQMVPNVILGLKRAYPALWILRVTQLRSPLT
jgi:hypothetical protein